MGKREREGKRLPWHRFFGWVTLSWFLGYEKWIWGCSLCPAMFPDVQVRLWGSDREGGRAWSRKSPLTALNEECSPCRELAAAPEPPVPVVLGKAELFRQPGEQRCVIYHREYPDVASVIAEAAMAEGWNDLGSSTSFFWNQSLWWMRVGTGDMSCSFSFLVPFIFSLFCVFSPLSFLRRKCYLQTICRNKPRGFEN